MIDKNMIKALKCLASQSTEGDCYADFYNFKRLDDDSKPRMLCAEGENLRDFISGGPAIGCPYYQKAYGTCFEDGELYWLKELAEQLEDIRPTTVIQNGDNCTHIDNVGTLIL